MSISVTKNLTGRTPDISSTFRNRRSGYDFTVLNRSRHTTNSSEIQVRVKARGGSIEPIISTIHEPKDSKVMQEIDQRLKDLEALCEEENQQISKESRSDFLNFMHLLNPLLRPFIFVYENNNLRAEWTHDDGRQIGLQFLGEERVQFVVFYKEQSDGIQNSACGRAGFDEILDLVNHHTFKDLHTA